MPDSFVTLDNLLHGGAGEMFGDELAKLVENILDPNTKATATRTVTLTVTVKPDKTRRKGVATVEASSKLAKGEGHETVLYFGTIEGAPVVYEENFRQVAMKFDQQPEDALAAGDRG